ncbi:MAG: hypothetical protein J5J00_11870 [Deltaproteobacteria bacterium]|nr:hypothetical protein [Deltaproteobacteria bacterium]
MIRFIACAVLCAASLGGCTEAGETTQIGAATGGVIGAGLGAIVGNQTGDPGSGLVIGAAAGAGTGALIANALEAQDENIRTQKEALERQERIIAAQRAEIEELRRMNGDGSNLRGRLRHEMQRDQSRQLPQAAPAAAVRAPTQGSYSSRLFDRPAAAVVQPPEALKERPVTAAPPATAEIPTRVGMKGAPAPAMQPARVASGQATGECAQAETESLKARSAAEAADRLFHLRRAIRLCPSNADYHASLGEVYLTLNRREDAQFEFKEAIALNPGHEAARRNLQALVTSNDDNRF